MTEEFNICEQAEREKHDEKVRELEHKKWTENYEKYQEASNNSTETYTTTNGLIAIAR